MSEDKHKTEIIVEIGCNWLGDEHLVANMISKAKNAGASSVKFQAFLPEHVRGHPLAKELMKSSVTEKNVGLLMDLAKVNSIEAFVTPFYPEAVDFLDKFVDKYKIRERDSRPIVPIEGESSSKEPTPLIRRVMETGKPIYMSVAGRVLDNYWRHQPIRFLSCVPSYPTRLEDLNLEACSVGYGLSCHCPEIIAPIAAATLMLNARFHNARIIEVHVSEEPKSAYVDGNVSFNFDELKTIVDSIRKLERMKLERLV